MYNPSQHKSHKPYGASDFISCHYCGKPLPSLSYTLDRQQYCYKCFQAKEAEERKRREEERKNRPKKKCQVCFCDLEEWKEEELGLGFITTVFPPQ